MLLLGLLERPDLTDLQRPVHKQVFSSSFSVLWCFFLCDTLEAKVQTQSLTGAEHVLLLSYILALAVVSELRKLETPVWRHAQPVTAHPASLLSAWYTLQRCTQAALHTAKWKCKPWNQDGKDVSVLP